MRFTLNYRGPLKSNRGPADKLALRRHFHPQLRELWGQRPLQGRLEKVGEAKLLRQVGAFTFLPLVAPALDLVAALRITMLRPGEPGAIVHGGDLDNRIKTLLDALGVPSAADAIPRGESPAEGEHPLFVLLDDDRLVTDVEVKTDRLLDARGDGSEVLLLIHVTTSAVVGTWNNIGL